MNPAEQAKVEKELMAARDRQSLDFARPRAAQIMRRPAASAKTRDLLAEPVSVLKRATI